MIKKRLSLKDSFIQFCSFHNYEQNVKQINILMMLKEFTGNKINFLSYFFKLKPKMCFYLYGNVGVGKTMLIDFVFNTLKVKKKRFHFNEFMIQFHDFRHGNQNNSILSFVLKLKQKAEIIYLDEFQVTNIVDAMILGKLFQTLFENNIKAIISSNIKLDDLYKDGLQREQFLPFISLIKSKSILKELIIEEDYRRLKSGKAQRYFYPANEKNNFKINQIFRELTKLKSPKIIELNIKGRLFKIKNFYEGIAKFDFKDLCEAHLGAEDYIKIANYCKIVVIQNIPNFTENNSNQQQRFITLIDIFYENKISLIVSCHASLNKITTSDLLKKPFNRTLSRLHELTIHN